MSYTTDDKVRYYLNASGQAGIGTDVIGTLAVSYAIQNAENIINFKLSKRYDVPFASVPPMIETIATKVAAWESMRSLYSGEIPSSIAELKEEYIRNMDFLEAIRVDDLDLPLGTSAGGGIVMDKGSTTKFWSSTQGYVPTMNVDDELNWRTDPNRLNDIASSRSI